MDWWHNLTPGQGTLLGGLAVFTAALIAFSTGWLDRRAEQRRLHYNEVKQVYVEALGLVEALRTTDAVPQNLREQFVRDIATNTQSIVARLSLTGKPKNAQALIDLVRFTGGVALARSQGITAEQLGVGDAIDSDAVLAAVRKELAAYLPRRSRYAGVLRAKGEVLPQLEPRTGSVEKPTVHY